MTYLKNNKFGIGMLLFAAAAMAVGCWLLGGNARIILGAAIVQIAVLSVFIAMAELWVVKGDEDGDEWDWDE